VELKVTDWQMNLWACDTVKGREGTGMTNTTHCISNTQSVYYI